MRKSSFNICIVDFGISFNVYIELALLIKFSLNDIGYKCLINKNLINKSSRNIVLGAQFFKISESKKLPKDTIIFNTEPIEATRKEWKEKLIRFVKEGYEFWDYNNKNIRYFHALGFKNNKEFIFGYNSNLKKIKKINFSERDIDILFYGSLNKRRYEILNSLSQNGFRVQHLKKVFGELRDSYISRSKVVLNLHFYSSQIFEIVRVFYLVTNGSFVISELNQKTTVNPLYKNYAVCCPYEEIIDNVNYFMNNESLIENLEMKHYNNIKKNLQTKFYKKTYLADTKLIVSLAFLKLLL